MEERGKQRGERRLSKEGGSKKGKSKEGQRKREKGR